MPRLAVAAFVTALAFSFPAFGQVPAEVGARLAAAALPASALGAIVVRLRDGAVVLTLGADRALQPASTLKLLTSWVALETLGPTWRGRTEILATGEIAEGVLRGDIALRGGADVDLDASAFDGMLRQLRVRGIREIRGDLVVDRTFFNPSRMDAGLRPFDESPEFRYNVVPDALLLNSNLVRLDMASDAKTHRVAMSPALEGVTVVSEMALVDRKCEDWEDGWRYPVVVEHVKGALQLRLQGEFPRDCAADTSINVIERATYVDRLFRASWRALGGTFRGVVREGPAPSGGRVLAEHQSRTLAEITRDINKQSDNPVTRAVFLALGAGGAGDTRPTAARAEERVRALLALRGIDATGLVLENGSGLSRIERIRPATLAAVLRAAQAGPWSPEFMASLPIASVDGGMRTRLNGTAASGIARIKTGTLRDVSAVAGYVPAADGETYVVAAMVNDPLATKDVARPVLDALLEWVARGPGRNPA